MKVLFLFIKKNLLSVIFLLLFVTNKSVHLEQIFSSPNEKNERYEQLYQCIAKLESFDKSIIVLYLEDLAYKDIAAIVGISENYVAVKIKRIKIQLKACLNKIP